MHIVRYCKYIKEFAFTDHDGVDKFPYLCIFRPSSQGHPQLPLLASINSHHLPCDPCQQILSTAPPSPPASSTQRGQESPAFNHISKWQKNQSTQSTHCAAVLHAACAYPIHAAHADRAQPCR